MPGQRHACDPNQQDHRQRASRSNELGSDNNIPSGSSTPITATTQAIPRWKRPASECGHGSISRVTSRPCGEVVQLCLTGQALQTTGLARYLTMRCSGSYDVGHSHWFPGKSRHHDRGGSGRRLSAIAARVAKPCGPWSRRRTRQRSGKRCSSTPRSRWSTWRCQGGVGGPAATGCFSTNNTSCGSSSVVGPRREYRRPCQAIHRNGSTPPMMKIRSPGIRPHSRRTFPGVVR